MALLTLDEAKEFLRITGTEEDSLISSLIEQASQMVETYCDRYIEKRTDLTEDFFHVKDRILVHAYPIISISAVQLVDANGDTTDVTDYTTNNNLGIIYLHSKHSDAHFRVTYTGGFETIPADIKFATMYLLGQIYRISADGAHGVTARTSPTGSVTYYIQDMAPVVKAVLDRYKRF